MTDWRILLEMAVRRVLREKVGGVPRRRRSRGEASE